MVCDNKWDNNNAKVVCRELKLGFNGHSTGLLGNTVVDGSGKFWMDDVACSGTESLYLLAHIMDGEPTTVVITKMLVLNI